MPAGIATPARRTARSGALIARFRPDMLGCFVLVDPTTPPVS